MYDFIRKAEFFRWWNRGLADKKARNLKSIQDAFILSQLRRYQGLRICEVGGGDSRVLQRLATRNTCVNVDKLEGAGNGPMAASAIAGVEVVSAYLGDFDPRLEDGSFDAVFSISVLEHVPDDRLQDCFMDMARILRPGGLMLHAIDLYVGDDIKPNPRVKAYAQCATHPELGLKWVDPPVIEEKVGFRCDYASNSDQQMASWNEKRERLAKIRALTQSCSLKMALRKEGPVGNLALPEPEDEPGEAG